MTTRRTCDYFYSRYNKSSLRFETVYCQNRPRHIAHMVFFPRPQWLCDEHKQKAVELAIEHEKETRFECAFVAREITKNHENSKTKLPDGVCYD